MSLNRHQIRELAFQYLFAKDANTDNDQDLINQLLEDTPVPPYFTTLIEGVDSHQTEIDDQITKFLADGWSLNRLAKTDLIILRIAFFEIQFVDDTPDKVAIDEALELTKTFSDEKSRKFVNGILGHLVK
ncbi:transcription antitermination factor NusB [Paucilactobacillus sp. N302-9]